MPESGLTAQVALQPRCPQCQASFQPKRNGRSIVRISAGTKYGCGRPYTAVNPADGQRHGKAVVSSIAIAIKNLQIPPAMSLGGTNAKGAQDSSNPDQCGRATRGSRRVELGVHKTVRFTSPDP